MHPGQQHKVPGSEYNPFLEPTISSYSAQQIATLQSKLNKQLGPEYLSQRAGPGGKKVHYIQADKLINLANEVFGFNGWSSTIKNIEVDYLDLNKENGKWSVGVSVTVRVTLKDGCYHEDIGYGSMENGKTKAQVFEKAKKEGTTDGLKRALRTFGNVLGLCLNDSEYMAKVARVKTVPLQFDESRLHRRIATETSEHPPQRIGNALPPAMKMQTASNRGTGVVSQPEEDFGDDVDEFDELGIFAGDGDVFDDLMPDGASPESMQPGPDIETPSKSMSNHTHSPGPVNPGLQTGKPNPQRAATNHAPESTKPIPQNVGQPQRPNGPLYPQNYQKMQAPAQINRPGVPSMPPTPMITPNRPKEPATHVPTSNPEEPPIPFRNPNNKNVPPPPNPTNPPIGFFTGRAALNMDENTVLSSEKSPAFDPHRPTTIPRSAGIDHSKSSPIPRKIIQPSHSNRPNLENPGANVTRQIGLPPGRSPYRPLSMVHPSANGGVKRGPDQADYSNTDRATLAPVSGQHLNVQHQFGGNQAKRPKT